MIAFLKSGIKKAILWALISALMLPLTSCDIIIINDMSEQNVSNPETEKIFPNGEAPYSPTEYTPYKSGEDNYALSESYLSRIPERDFEGTAFFITTPSVEYIDPDNTATTVSRMIYERNRKIEDWYNISIVTSLAESDSMLGQLKQAVEADLYYTDLMMIPLYMTGQFRMEKVLMNLRSIPFLNLSAPYFNEESISMTSAGYGTYGVAGHATLSPSSFSAMFFNRDLVTESGMPQPYSLAKNGEWTWDKFFEYTAAVRALNEDRGTHYYTVGAENNATRLADLVFVSMGNSYITAERKTVPKIAFTPESAEAAVSVANRILTDPNAVTDASAGAIERFANGEMLFLTEYLQLLPRISDSAADWGVLPLPTASEGDAYRTLVSNNELIFTIPVNHTNAEMASVLLSALNAASYGYLYDEYVTYSMYHTLRDNDSVNMLEIILDTASFDFALAYGNAYPAVASATYGLIREAARGGNLEELYGNAKASVDASIDKDFNFEY